MAKKNGVLQKSRTEGSMASTGGDSMTKATPAQAMRRPQASRNKP
jgi:hypothetical protein